MDLLLHFKVNEGDENNINIQEYMLYGDVETKSEKCLVDEGDEVVLTEFPVHLSQHPCTHHLDCKVLVYIQTRHLHCLIYWNVFLILQ